MSYSDFTIADLKQRFGLPLEKTSDLFGATPEAELPPPLAVTRSRYLPLAVNVNTKKARGADDLAGLGGRDRAPDPDASDNIRDPDPNCPGGASPDGRSIVASSLPSR